MMAVPENFVTMSSRAKSSGATRKKTESRDIIAVSFKFVGSFFTLALFSSLLTVSAHAQSSWEASLLVSSFNTYYQENFNNPADGDPEDVKGNAWDALQLHPMLTYLAQRGLGLPLFVIVDAQIPLVTVKRLEIGDEYEPAGMTDLTQEEQVAHADLTGRAILGWEMLPCLQPYLGIVRSRFTSERTGQLNGDEEGHLIPDANRDYTETVYSTHLCFGLEGTIPLATSSSIQLRYDAAYEIPEAVFVSNSYFGPGTWGQGTTGYTIGGTVQLDVPFSAINLSAVNNAYFSIGGMLYRREWDGNGATGTAWYQGYSLEVSWPKNFTVEAGGFLGVGMFF